MIAFDSLKNSAKGLGSLGLIALGLLAGVAGTLLWPSQRPFLKDSLGSEEEIPFTSSLTNNFFEEAYALEKLIQQFYVKSLSPKEITKINQAAFSGMIEALDPHSTYLTPQMMKELQESIQGQFCGVGLEISPSIRGSLHIISAIEETSAFSAGLLAGDKILRIDDRNVYDISPQQAIRKMRGPAGSFVTLLIKRESKEPFIVKLKRQPINFKSVHWKRESENIGYLRISYFDDKAKRLVQEALLSLQASSKPPLKGLLIDVRNNPGGLLEQAIGVTDLFLEGGVITLTQTRENKEGTVVYANPKTSQRIHQIPLVILTNAGSASGAELFAGALQDNKRALIVGERTFGKASMQAIYNLNEGAGLRLTIAHYATPSGRSIQGKGILPDIPITVQYKISDPKDPPLREENLASHDSSSLLKQKKNPFSHDPKTEKKEKITDYQRSYALDLLRGITLYHPSRKEGNA